MFSMTDIFVRLFVSWNVRTMPSFATLWAATPSSSWPLNVHRPELASSNPVTTLKKVVLPAPFGPINAVIDPRWTSRWSTSTATMPPN